MYTRPLSEEEMRAGGFEPEDFAEDDVEVWPENRAAFELFCQMQTQWNVGFSGHTGLQYLVLFALMARMGITGSEQDLLFEDIQVMELAALQAMHTK